MTTPLPKRYGYKLPLEALGGVCVRVSIEFPDKLEYRAAFNGAINMLGKWFQWDHTQADYQDIPELNVEVAQVWSEVLAAATWEECVEFCARLIECLTTDSDVQDALAELIATNPAIKAAITNIVQDHTPNASDYPNNTQLPAGVSSGNISIDNPDCDPDILWAQCVGFVQTANRMTTDFLETWETYTNSAETIPAIIQAIPFLGEVADIIGIDGIAAYANSLIDSIAENYAADYTLDYENELACEIFCASKDTCVVSLDEMCGILNARVGGALNLTNGIELMLSLIDADVSGLNVADLYLCAFFNMLKLANLVLPITWGIESYLRVTRTFNQGNDDWMVLCTDCPSNWCRSLTGDDLHTMAVASGGLPGGQAAWTGTGWGPNFGAINSRITIKVDMLDSYQLLSVVAIYSGTNAIGDRNNVTVWNNDFTVSYGVNVWTEETIIGLSTEPTLQVFNVDTVSSFDTSVPITVELIELRITGTGTPPEWGVACD